MLSSAHPCYPRLPKSLSLTTDINLSDKNYFIEESVLDLNTNQYTAVTQNLSLTNYFTCEETISYQPHSHNKTLFTSQARVAAVGFPAIASIVEKACVTRFQQNASIGRKGLESIIEKIKDEFKEFGTNAEHTVERARDDIMKARDDFLANWDHPLQFIIN